MGTTVSQDSAAGEGSEKTPQAENSYRSQSADDQVLYQEQVHGDAVPANADSTTDADSQKPSGADEPGATNMMLSGQDVANGHRDKQVVATTSEEMLGEMLVEPHSKIKGCEAHVVPGRHAAMPAAYPQTVSEALELPPDEFAWICARFVDRFDRDGDGLLTDCEFWMLAHAFAAALGEQSLDDARVDEWLKLHSGKNEEGPITQGSNVGACSSGDTAACNAGSTEAFAAFAQHMLEAVQAGGRGEALVPWPTLATMKQQVSGAHAMKLDASNFFKQAPGMTLRVLVTSVEATDRSFEPSEELTCEIRVFPPRSAFMPSFFHEPAHVGIKTTASVCGEESNTDTNKVSWQFGEELTFDSEAVTHEVRGDGALQAQVSIARPGGEKLASTVLFTVPTEMDRREPLWTRTVFGRRVGQVSLAAGWIGPDLVGWLASEVLNRACSGRWTWVATTLRRMDSSQVLELVNGSTDDEGRGVLAYASMSSGASPDAADVVEMLLTAKVDPCVSDSEGLTATHYAALCGADVVLRSLLRARATPDAEASGTVTPLMLASFGGSSLTVESLFNFGAAVDVVDKKGLSAACWVCLGCNEPKLEGTPSREKSHAAESSTDAEDSKPCQKEFEHITKGLQEALSRCKTKGTDMWSGSNRCQLLGHLASRLVQITYAAEAQAAIIEKIWQPLVRAAASPDPLQCGCFAELTKQLAQFQELSATVLGSVLLSAVAAGSPSEEELCRKLLSECSDIPVAGCLPDGRTLIEASLELGWDEVSILLCERGAVVAADDAAQTRALRAAVEGGRKELATRLVRRWAETRDVWNKPALPATAGCAECPVCFSALYENPGSLFDEDGHRACQHLICLSCASELGKQSQHPRCPICRNLFKPPAQRPPVPLEDPGGWFAFFDETGTGQLEQALLEQVLPAVLPLDAAQLASALRGDLWKEWDPSGTGHISRATFCSERGLLRWLVEHFAELQEDEERGQTPSLEHTPEKWFQHWARPDTGTMGKGEVLRAFLKSAGISSLETEAVESSRQWIDKCWESSDRSDTDMIDYATFSAGGGLGVVILQQSAIASARRVVRRMEPGSSDSASFVICCQQLVECAVGIGAEDHPSQWSSKACKRLRQRAASSVREEYEAVLCDGAEQVVAAMQRDHRSAKLFAWCCLTLTALSFPPLALDDTAARTLDDDDACLDQALELLLQPAVQTNVSPLEKKGADLGSQVVADSLEEVPACDGNVTNASNNELNECKEDSLGTALKAPTDHIKEPLWRLVVQGFVNLLPEQASQGGGTSRPSLKLNLAPGVLREAGVCALGALRVLADRRGPGAGEEVCATLAAVLQGAGNDGNELGATAASSGGFTSWVQGLFGLIGGSKMPPAALVAWAAAAIVTLSADARELSRALLAANDELGFVPRLSTLLKALGKGIGYRPPTDSALVAELTQALLAGLHSLPPMMRAGAGGGVGSETPGALHRSRTRDRRITVGDAVRMNPDLETVRQQQEPAEHFGGWCDRMAFCLDFPGRVVEIPRRAPRMPEVLRISHGAMGCWCWNAAVVLEVIPDAGLLPFEESESGPGVTLIIGDEVRVAVGIEEAKKLQVNHGGWNERMAQCCGKIGRLEAIDKAGDMKILVPGVGAFVWNPAALRAPQAQWWEAALCERLRGPLEGTLPLVVLAALITLGGRLDQDDGLKAALQAAKADKQAREDAGGSSLHLSGWSALVAAALSIDASKAAETIDSGCHPSMSEVMRPRAVSVITEEFADTAQPCNDASKSVEEGGSMSVAQACTWSLADHNITLFQIVEAWWDSLPSSERRARSI